MIVLVDNYDSFSYNLFQLVGTITPNIHVIRNDACSVNEVIDFNPRAIILSPGPGRPADAGICEALIQKCSGNIPLLGVCLGHQAICEAFGGRVGYAQELMHGKSSIVQLSDQTPLFEGVGTTTEVARYHSLAADRETLPDCLKVIAKTDEGEIMAVQHETHPTFGVQFHPESIMTPCGPRMLENFIAYANAWHDAQIRI